MIKASNKNGRGMKLIWMVFYLAKRQCNRIRKIIAMSHPTSQAKKMFFVTISVVTYG
jgi:hypothetical protein